jgi:two-component system response regulator PilR (NtrC family)
MIERAVTLATTDYLKIDSFPNLVDLPSSSANGCSAAVLPEDGMELERVLEDFERAILIQALEKAGGNRTEAARILHVSFRSMRYRLSKLGISGTDTGTETQSDPSLSDS